MIKFMYNGIKVDGKLYKAHYSQSALMNHEKGTITIYARNYKPLPAVVGLTVIDDSDLITDYIENEKARVTPDNPWYPQVLTAYQKQQAHREKVYGKERAAHLR